MLGGEVQLEQNLAGARSAGFTGACLDIASVREASGSNEPDGAARLVEDSGLRVLDIAILTAHVDDSRWEHEFGEFLNFVQQLRPVFLCMRPGQAADDRFVRRIAEADAELAARGTRLLLEPLALGAVASISQALSLLEAAGATSAALVLDAWHFFTGRWRWPELEALPLDAIGYVQISDGVPLDAGVPFTEQASNRRLLPGDGTFDLRRFVRTLELRGYHGWYCAEVLSRHLRARPTEDVYRRNLSALAGLLDHASSPQAAPASRLQPAKQTPSHRLDLLHRPEEEP
jgi:sugar phosphate isomerase/epimerase